MLARLKSFLKSNRNVFLIFLILGLVLYSNSFGNEMFWDDQDNILFNAFVHDWKYFPKYFTENNVAGRGLISNYWRPLPLTIWSIEWHLWQDWAPGYHFVQTMLHISAAFLLFNLLNKFFNNQLLSLLTSVLFLAHPLQTEAITYVSGISDPLSAMLIFSSLIFYIKNREHPSKYLFTCSLVLFSLSFLARETTVFFLLYFVLAEFILHLKKHKNILWSSLFLNYIKLLWPYMTIAGVYIFLRLSVLNFQNTLNLYDTLSVHDEQNEFTSNPLIRLFTFFRILTVYAQLLFWPQNLHMERTVELATTLWKPDILIGASVLISSLPVLIVFLKRNRLVVFSIAWILISLFPTSNILVPINGLLFEHWLYLPMVGVWLLIMWLGLKLARKHKIYSYLFVLLLLSYFVLLSSKTIRQNRIWSDPITFYNYTLKLAPTSYRLLNNLGMAYADKNAHEEAIRVYQLAISVNPSNAVAYHNLGNTYKAVGDKQKAMSNFEKAILLQPDFYFSYNALAQLYLDNKEYKKAAEVLEKLLPHTTGAQHISTQNLILQLQSQK